MKIASYVFEKITMFNKGAIFLLSNPPYVFALYTLPFIIVRLLDTTKYAWWSKFVRLFINRKCVESVSVGVLRCSVDGRSMYVCQSS